MNLFLLQSHTYVRLLSLLSSQVKSQINHSSSPRWKDLHIFYATHAVKQINKQYPGQKRFATNKPSLNIQIP